MYTSYQFKFCAKYVPSIFFSAGCTIAEIQCAKYVPSLPTIFFSAGCTIAEIQYFNCLNLFWSEVLIEMVSHFFTEVGWNCFPLPALKL